MWAMRWFPTLILNLLQFHQRYHLTASGNITSVTGLDSLVVFVVIINNNIINNNLWMSSILHHGKDALCQIRYFIWCNLYFSIPFVFCFEQFQSEFFFLIFHFGQAIGKTALQPYDSVARYQIAQWWLTDSFVLEKKLAGLRSLSCLKLFTIYPCQKEKNRD